MRQPERNRESSDDQLQLELARLRALHHIHDAARIMTDATCYVPPDLRQLWTSVVGGLSTLERHMNDLAPLMQHKPEEAE
jgi:hypothetical protein